MTRFAFSGTRLLIPTVFVLLTVFPLSGQSRRDVVIYISPVSGAGGSGAENFFTAMTEMEVAARGYALGDSAAASDYTLEGTLRPYQMEYDDGGSDESWYAMHLTLKNAETGERMVEQDIMYQQLTDVNEFFPFLVFSMLANIPLTKDAGDSNTIIIGPEPPDERWRNKYLYIGLTAAWSPRFYDSKNIAMYPANIGLGALVEWHLLRYLSIETGVEYSEDRLATPSGEARMPSLEIPLLVKMVFKPGFHFMLEPYIGAQTHFSLGKRSINIPFLSWAAGFQFGTKVGPGAIIVDIRFAMDQGKSNLVGSWNVPVPEFQRYMGKFGVGYKLGFFDRQLKVK